jgi:hypothetical protein
VVGAPVPEGEPRFLRNGWHVSDPSAPPPSSGPRRSYFIRHWRGELSLRVSYWVNTVVPSWVVQLLQPSLKSSASSDFLADYPHVGSASIVVLWVSSYVLAIWQSVGVWRSAQRHIEQTGRRRWARAAQATTIVALLTWAVLTVTVAGPQIWAFGRIAVGDDPIPVSDVRVVAGGQEIEVAGPIGFGTSSRVAGRLQLYPHVHVLRLNSLGGRVTEARRLRDIAASNRLTTYTSTGCFSACTLAFAGGRERVVYKGAKVGFHQYAFPGVLPGQFDAEYAQDRSFLLSLGVDPFFVHRMFALSSDDMWEPSSDELLKARFITATSDGSEFAIDTTDPDSWMREFRQGLTETPVYRAIAARDPVAYEATLATIKAIVERQGLQGETVAALHSLVGSSLTRHLPDASDEALLYFAHHIVAALEYLGRRDAKACIAYLSDKKSGVALSPELQGAEIEVTRIVLESAVKPRKPPSQQEWSPLAARVILQLKARYGAAVALLDNVESSNVDPRVGCALMKDLYAEILRLPRAQAAVVLRGLLTSS